MSTTFYNTLLISNVLVLLIWTPFVYSIIKFEVRNLCKPKHRRAELTKLDAISYLVILFSYLFVWFTFYLLIKNY
jgi:hypothetical protein